MHNLQPFHRSSWGQHWENQWQRPADNNCPRHCVHLVLIPWVMSSGKSLHFIKRLSHFFPHLVGLPICLFPRLPFLQYFSFHHIDPHPGPATKPLATTQESMYILILNCFSFHTKWNDQSSAYWENFPSLLSFSIITGGIAGILL